MRSWIALSIGLAAILSGASARFDDPIVVPEGLEVTLWAESPLFFNPTNIDIDARGRIWVTEAVNYRDFNNTPELRHADIGPDLGSIAGKFDVPGLTEAVDDPDASVALGYVPNIVTTTGGGATAEFILSDDDVVLLCQVDGRRVSIPGHEIESRIAMPGSLMPDSEMLGLSAQDVADVVRFLTEAAR